MNNSKVIVKQSCYGNHVKAIKLWTLTTTYIDQFGTTIVGPGRRSTGGALLGSGSLLVAIAHNLDAAVIHAEADQEVLDGT